jgi:hypothetical protein
MSRKDIELPKKKGKPTLKKSMKILLDKFFSEWT